jgi:hypothetical protein
VRQFALLDRILTESARLNGRGKSGAYADLRRTVAAAEDAFADAQANLATREAALRAVMAAHDQLAARVAADRGRLESARQRRAEARQAADRNFMAAWQSFTRAFRAAVPGLASPATALRSGSGSGWGGWSMRGSAKCFRAGPVIPLLIPQQTGIPQRNGRWPGTARCTRTSTS